MLCQWFPFPSCTLYILQNHFMILEDFTAFMKHTSPLISISIYDRLQEIILYSRFIATLFYAGVVCCRASCYRTFVCVFSCRQSEWQCLFRQAFCDACSLQCWLHWTFCKSQSPACLLSTGCQILILIFVDEISPV